MVKVNKTTKKDFAIFKKAVLFWQEYFGLKNWEFLIVHEEHESLKEVRAWCGYNVKGKIATIGLATEWNEIIDERQIRKSAFHEVCEAMLSPLWAIGSPHESEEWHYNAAVHDIIRTLENTIFSANLCRCKE